MDFKALILAKEQELHSINEFRLTSLESMVQSKVRRQPIYLNYT